MALTVAEIDTAIQEITLNGQSFTLDGVTYNRGNLGSLIQLRKQVQSETATSGGTRPLMRGFGLSGMGY